MEFFRRVNKRLLLLWGLLLFLSLLCVQGVALHIHSLDYGHGDHHNYSHAIEEESGHAHLSKAHFTHDTSHNDNHDGTVSEIDVSPDGLLKKSSKNISSMALIAFFFILVMFVSSLQLIHRCSESRRSPQRFYFLNPPLRTPPSTNSSLFISG